MKTTEAVSGAVCSLSAVASWSQSTQLGGLFVCLKPIHVWNVPSDIH